MHSIYKTILRAEAILAGVLLMIMVFTILLGGVARMMAFPLNWTIDVATACFAWGVFLCADIAWRNNMLMALDLFTTKMSVRAQRMLVLVNHVIIVGFLGYAVYAGIVLSWSGRVRTFNGLPGVSYSWVTSSIAVGSGLMLITTILKIRDLLHTNSVPAATVS